MSLPQYMPQAGFAILVTDTDPYFDHIVRQYAIDAGYTGADEADGIDPYDKAIDILYDTGYFYTDVSDITFDRLDGNGHVPVHWNSEMFILWADALLYPDKEALATHLRERHGDLLTLGFGYSTHAGFVTINRIFT